MFKNKQILIIATLILFLVSPMLYLFLKTLKTPEHPKEQPAITSPSITDIAALEKIVKSNPSLDNLINLSIAYINNKMPGKSIEPLKKAIELNPNNAVAYNDIGVAYIMLEQYQNGIDACSKALQLDPKFQLAKNNLKWGMDEKSKILAAIQLQEQTSQNKRNANFYIAYGLNYFKIGKYDKSIEIWKKIFDIEPKNTTALSNIGTAFMMKYQYDDAIVLFKKVIELEPTNQLAKNNLAWAMGEKSRKK